VCRSSVVNKQSYKMIRHVTFGYLISGWALVNFWHSGALVLRTECQSVGMSKIRNCGLDQYGTGPFKQQQFGTAGIND